MTNSINPLVACGAELFASFMAPADDGAAGDDGAEKSLGVNTLMTMMQEYLPVLLQDELIGERTAESYAAVDVAGYNYLESRYEMDHELFPNRVIVGSETMPAQIDGNWKLVRSHAHVIGDFTWTGWDYLGEAGIGRVEFGGATGGEMRGLMGSYPWLTACTGDIDITGFRRPVSYYREIVFGLRSDPYLAVQRPQHHGEVPSHVSPWSLIEGASSWSWPGFEGEPVTVEVYADAEEVELLVNETPVGRAPAGDRARYRATFETAYEVGSIVAVAYRDGLEVGRTSLQSAAADVQLRVRVDRDEIRADDADLAYVEIELTDASGTLHVSRDRSVTVTVDGPAVLQGLGSANPCTEETFGGATHDTYDGRALAVIRPTGPGAIVVSVSAESCDPVQVGVEALP